MSQCTNCNAKLSCGCQRRTASNGTAVCSNCIQNYEQKLKTANTGQASPPPGANFTKK